MDLPPHIMPLLMETIQEHTGAPGAHTHPGPSQNGKSNCCDPGGAFKRLRFFEHYACFPNWDAHKLKPDMTQTNFIILIMLNTMVFVPKLAHIPSLGQLLITWFSNWDRSQIGTWLLNVKKSCKRLRVYGKRLLPGTSCHPISGCFHFNFIW